MSVTIYHTKEYKHEYDGPVSDKNLKLIENFNNKPLKDRIDIINKVFCRHGYVNDEYLDIQDQAIKARRSLLRELEKRIDKSKIPEYFRSYWFENGVAYGRVLYATFSHWSAPILGENTVSLFVEWDRVRNGNMWVNQWVWDYDGHDSLIPIDSKEYYKNRRVITLQDRYDDLQRYAKYLVNMIGQDNIKRNRMTAAEARTTYIEKLIKESPEEILKETRQMMLDILDATEQSQNEEHIIAALDAFEKSVKG